MPLKRFIDNRLVLAAFGAVVLTLYFMPYFLYGQDVYVRVFDNLDANVVWYKVLAHSGKIFADSMAIIPNMMGGLPRLSYGSEFNVILWLYYFFDDFTAYVINDVFIHFFAFFSMAVLLQRYFIPRDTPYRNLIVYSTSLLFAIIPFWPHGGLSVPAQPLVLWAYLNIRSGDYGKKEWLVLALVPLYSSFILAMFFLLLGIGLLFLYDWITQRKFNTVFFAALVFMTAVYLGVEYRLVANMLLPSDFVSHRAEFVIPAHSIQQMLDFNLNVRFVIGYKNTYALQFYILLPFLVTVLALAAVLKEKTENTQSRNLLALGIAGLFLLLYLTGLWEMLTTSHLFLPGLLCGLIILFIKRPQYRFLYVLFMLQIVLTVMTEVWFCECIEYLRAVFPFFERFNMARVGYLQPMVWYVLLGYAFVVAGRLLPMMPLLIGLVVSLQISNAFEHRLFIKLDDSNFTYRNFYAAEQFSLIKQEIGSDPHSYRVASIDIHPVVAVYNGLYTVDGYSANYPLAYKHRFREAMSEFIDHNNFIQGVYDRWGSRCYLFGDGFNYDEYDKERVLKRFYVNTDVLHDMGVRYIISANKIADPQRMSLELMKVFDDEKWYWRLYLYRLNT